MPISGRVSGFTLVELLVVIVIIALLISLLLPSLSGARNQAKATATRALIAGVDAGQVSRQTALGSVGALVPSASDSWRDSGASNVYGRGADPVGDGTTASMVDDLPGVSLLVYGLMGADRRGAIDFRDVNGSGYWYDDLGNDYNSSSIPSSGLHALHPQGSPHAGNPVHPRYRSLVGENIMDRARRISDLILDGIIVNGATLNLTSEQQRQFVLVDAWHRPMLYYRARKSAKIMVTNIALNALGVYDQRDNQLITGISGPSIATPLTGMDFGAGVQPNGELHMLTKHFPADRFYSTDPVDTNDASFQGTFTRFIWDPRGKPLNEPYRPDSYMLISAGGDAVFGTNDDVTDHVRQ